MSRTAAPKRAPGSRAWAAVLAALAHLAFFADGARAETFGNTTVGSASAVPAAGYKFGTIYRLPQAGTVESFSWHTRGGDTEQRLTPAIYRVDSLGMPSALVVTGSEVRVAANQAAGWVTSALPPTSLAAGDYLLALTSGPNSGQAANAYQPAFDSGFWNADAYGSPSSTWGRINREGMSWSFYVTYTPAAAESSAPTSSAPPSISGVAQAGETLTASSGTWDGEPPPELSEQWQACQADACVDIAGATGKTYTVRSDDVGKTLRVVVTATNSAGTANATSAPTATVTAPDPEPEPGVTGLFGTDVPGSAGDTTGHGYKLGSIYRLHDDATLGDFRFYARGGTWDQAFVPAVYATSAGRPSTLLAKAPPVTVRAGSAPAWHGAPLTAGVSLEPGDYLLALVPGPNHQAAFVYNDPTSTMTGWWNLNGYPEPSATWGAINTEGKRWSFHVTYGTAGTPVPPVNETPPAITGSPHVGKTLTATNGTWTNNPTSYDHEWRRCQDQACTPIPGATGTTYTLTAADDGSSLLVVVGATNRAGRTEAESSRTAVVEAPTGPTVQPFGQFTVDANPIGSVIEKTLADLNGDGRLDAVIGMQASSQGGSGGVFWYQQPSSGNFAEPWVKRTILPSGRAYEDAAPLDVDADGHVDVVASVDNRIWWFRNPGAGVGTWQQNLIGDGYRENTMRIGDLDGDGRPDVVTNSAMFFQNGPYSWTTVPYNNTHGGVALLDVGSGRGPINLVANNGPSHTSIVWFENPREHGGDARTGTWTKRTIGPGYLCTGGTSQCPEGSVATLATAEINGDGRVDVVSGQSEHELAPGGLRWYEAPADRTAPWTTHDIHAGYKNTHNVGVGDVDGNGAIDVVAGEQDQSAHRRLGVFYNDGDGGFVEQVLTTSASHNVAVGDVEGDGDVDILAGPHGWYGDPHPVWLFRNGRLGE